MTPPFSTVCIRPLQLRMGDRLDDVDGDWAVIGGPWSGADGRMYACVQRPGDPGSKKELAWAADEAITVRWIL